MPGKQAKILAADQIDNLLLFAETTRYPLRDRVIVLLSVKAGLRAAEIANLTWEMVLDANGTVTTVLELRDCAAKKGHGRTIPLHADLREALSALQGISEPSRPVVLSERGRKMRARSIVIWFGRAYRAINLDGCSSHSGRRTFITRAARLVHKAGGSLRDVQLLAGHRSIQTTQGYIDGDSDAQRRLVSLI
ncbi:site-specific integrase [Bradyrhizobium sp. 168]|uniref:tyrosine-type recombinase/integrase n=1 Tax=Bradyrhizobium sp. 168 TaxID=2782639 RepID=UPI001FF9BD62|nr:site-specific integrase [Bradyrhizobium sp. 168]MCK1580661.1 site-specific integrase [Bradyrhizobium sp. 168]